MPRGDRTGPVGMGARTGRAAGFCAGYPAPGFANLVGRGGRAFGGGRRGYRNMYYATGVPGWARFGVPGEAPPVYGQPAAGQVPEEEVLRNQSDFLKQQLTDIEKRLTELEEG